MFITILRYMKSEDLELESLKHQFYDFEADFNQNGWSPEIEENVAQMALQLSASLKSAPKSKAAQYKDFLEQIHGLMYCINPSHGH